MATITRGKGKVGLYLSCPMTIPLEKLVAVERDLTARYGDVFRIKRWARESPYDKSSLTSSSVFVVMLPNNCFNYKINNLPLGTKTELEYAIQTGMKIFIAYKKVFNEIQFYKVKIIDGHIVGSSGNYLQDLVDIKNNRPDLIERKLMFESNVNSKNDRRRFLLVK